MSKQRALLLDTLRGLALVNMMAYHATWDFIYLAGRNPAWYSESWGYYWQQGICWTFILLSGFCWPLGRNHLRHGLTVFGCGLVVMAVTLIAEPEAAVWWGVLSLLGGAALLLIPLEPLFRRIPGAVGAAASMLCFALTRHAYWGSVGIRGFFSVALPDWLYQNKLTAYLGFPEPGFVSTDYFPLLPWMFLFFAGYFLHRLLWERVKGSQLLWFSCPPLTWLGQRSLVLYMFHQPVIYGAMTALFWLGVFG